jgi:hypothetical protein
MATGIESKLRSEIAEQEKAAQADIRRLREQYDQDVKELRRAQSDELRQYGEHINALRVQLRGALAQGEEDVRRRLEAQKAAVEASILRVQREEEDRINARAEILRQEINRRCKALEQSFEQLRGEVNADRAAAMSYAAECREAAEACMLRLEENDDLRNFHADELVNFREQLRRIDDSFRAKIYPAAAAQAIAFEFDAKRCEDQTLEQARVWKYWWTRLESVYAELDRRIKSLNPFKVRYGPEENPVDVEADEFCPQAIARLREDFKGAKAILEVVPRVPLDALQIALVDATAFDDRIEDIRREAARLAEILERAVYAVRICRECLAEGEFPEWESADADVTLRPDGAVSILFWHRTASYQLDLSVLNRFTQEDRQLWVDIRAVPVFGYNISPSGVNEMVLNALHPIRKALDSRERRFSFTMGEPRDYVSQGGQCEWLLSGSADITVQLVGVREPLDNDLIRDAD